MDRADSVWPSFLRVFLRAAAGLVGGLWLALALIDPWDTLPLSLPFPRSPADPNQRYSYPALARDAAGRFDSAVFGTSTVRLLRPDELAASLGGRWANLAMNSATAWEQAQLLRLFARHHPEAQQILIGLDVAWCGTAAETPRLTDRPFPPFLYDEDPWNDYLYLLNDKALEIAARQLSYAFGFEAPRFGHDGWENFLPPDAAYDATRAAAQLWGAAGPSPLPKPAADPPEPITPEDAATPALAGLGPALADLAAETRVWLVFVPVHAGTQPAPGTRAAARWQACKERAVALARTRPGTVVLDLMRPTRVTMADQNYWDPLHTRVWVAASLPGWLAAAARDGRSAGDEAVRLHP